MAAVTGLHHVTAIAGNAQENLDFYAGVLGMRLVKKSVNQDDPGTYHLFYADAEGHPGSDLTFFPWPDLPPGRRGAGLTVEVALAVPRGSLDFWRERLAEHGVTPGPMETRFGEPVLPLADPHGLPLALALSDDPREFTPWPASPVPAAHQIRGLHGVRLWERDLVTTERFLTGALGFTAAGEEHGWHRFVVDGGGSGRYLELRETPGERQGAWGVGSVHHVAWRVPDDVAQQAAWERVHDAGRGPTEVIDRFWFRSVYFREPGGALFEIATDGPGFAVDEPRDTLGTALVLPPWLEPQRTRIEAALPPLRPPAPAGAPAAAGRRG
ncbi:MAG TPA: ring-cleaving dioxygenase [Gemmatimonadales bacterium]|nr:ring-cleaving dioxygenase [Gemmatimonadales bacterium]